MSWWLATGTSRNPRKRAHQSDRPPKVPLAPTGPTSSANLRTSIAARSTFAPVEAAVGNAAGGGGAPTRSGEVVPDVNERTAVWKSRPIEQSGKTAGISPTPTSRCRTAAGEAGEEGGPGVSAKRSKSRSRKAADSWSSLERARGDSRARSPCLTNQCACSNSNPGGTYGCWASSACARGIKWGFGG